MEQGHNSTLAQDAGDMGNQGISSGAEGSRETAGEHPLEDRTDGMRKGRETVPIDQVAGEASAASTAMHAADTGQPHHQWAPHSLPPGYAIEPATGRIVYIGALPQQPIHDGGMPPGVVYVQAESPEQAAARLAMEQQRHGQIVHSFEQFMQGDATVSDVVKTLYASTAQNDQLWKGVLVGAAAAVLCTSKPVREAMGRTLGSVFPGLQSKRQAGGPSAAPGSDSSTPDKKE